MKIIINPATHTFCPQNFENFVYIETVKYTTRNCSLADAITEAENTGADAIPPDIGVLEHINEYIGSEENF